MQLEPEAHSRAYEPTMMEIASVLAHLNICLVKVGCKAALPLKKLIKTPEEALLIESGFAFQGLEDASIASEGKEPECSICYVAFAESDVIIKHDICQQTYHHECLFSWTSENDSCPQCRGRITQPLPNQERRRKAEDVTARHIRLIEASILDTVRSQVSPFIPLHEMESELIKVLAQLDREQLQDFFMELHRFQDLKLFHLPALEELSSHMLKYNDGECAEILAGLGELKNQLGAINYGTSVDKIRTKVVEWHMLLVELGTCLQHCEATGPRLLYGASIPYRTKMAKPRADYLQVVFDKKDILRNVGLYSYALNYLSIMAASEARLGDDESEDESDDESVDESGDESDSSSVPGSPMSID